MRLLWPAPTRTSSLNMPDATEQAAHDAPHCIASCCCCHKSCRTRTCIASSLHPFGGGSLRPDAPAAGPDQEARCYCASAGSHQKGCETPHLYGQLAVGEAGGPQQLHVAGLHLHSQRGQQAGVIHPAIGRSGTFGTDQCLHCPGGASLHLPAACRSERAPSSFNKQKHVL